MQGLKPHELKSDTVLRYRLTQATVASVWPQPPIDLQESDFKTSESCVQLFSRLLEHVRTWQQIIILKDLLHKWQQFQDINIR